MWHRIELAGGTAKLRHQVGQLQVEREVLDRWLQRHESMQELTDGVHEQLQRALVVLAKCEHPNLDTVQHLPRVNLLGSLFSRVVAHIPQVQQELTQVQEAELVGCLEVQREQLNEAVLSESQAVLYAEAATARARFLRELPVHLLDTELKEILSAEFSLFLVIRGQVVFVEQQQRLESQQLSAAVNGGVSHD